jgi:ABC-2 type transport system ATP-binding protein
MSGLDTLSGSPVRGPATEAVIAVRGLEKRYGDFEAVRGIDLEVRTGEIFAFLGPNGAGKTTTVEILEGFLEPTSGEVTVLGENPAHADQAWRDRIGVVLQESLPEYWLTVRECLELYAGYYARPRGVDETIDLVGLEHRAQARTERLSGGERRRLDVALALIGDPDVLFLDEPTTGFDPSARRAAWEVIDGLRKLGNTIFLTTHYMEEAERLADRIAVIVQGRIVAGGTPRALGGRDRMAAAITFSLPADVTHADLPDALRPLAETIDDGRYEVRSEAPLVHLGALALWAISRGLDIPDLEVRRPTLEDVYLTLTEDNGKDER